MSMSRFLGTFWSIIVISIILLSAGCGGGGGGNDEGGTEALSLTLNSPAGDVTINEGEAVTFQVTVSGGTTPYSFQWNYGGGSTDSSVEDPGQITFTNAGSYTVILTVTDNKGTTKTVSVIITVHQNTVSPIIWSKYFGSTGDDTASSIQKTSDGGYIIAGSTGSYGAGNSDFWLFKTDMNGNMVLNKTFGGAGKDTASFAQQTSDGGYIIVGTTRSYGAGNDDFWLIKTDASGNKIWDKTFGDTGFDCAHSVQQTSDGGYILTGFTELYSVGNYCVWLIKTDASGNKIWDKTFGDTGFDKAYSVQQTSDGGYILAGSTNDYNDNAWLIKTDADGNKMWDKAFGGTGTDRAYSVQQTSDGGYILAGSSDDSAGIVSALLIKTDSTGTIVWSKTFGTGSAFANSVQQTNDGGFILAACIESIGFSGEENFDAWLIKTDANGNIVWNKTLNGKGEDFAHYVIQTSDGGYIMAGASAPGPWDNGDVWLIKTDTNGDY